MPVPTSTSQPCTSDSTNAHPRRFSMRTLMLLATPTPGDVYLVGTPKINYFKVVYRKKDPINS
jgi:hypothetical protein